MMHLGGIIPGILLIISSLGVFFVIMRYLWAPVDACFAIGWGLLLFLMSGGMNHRQKEAG